MGRRIMDARSVGRVNLETCRTDIIVLGVRLYQMHVAHGDVFARLFPNLRTRYYHLWVNNKTSQMGTRFKSVK